MTAILRIITACGPASPDFGKSVVAAMSAIHGACIWIVGMCATGRYGMISPYYAKHFRRCCTEAALTSSMPPFQVQTLDKARLQRASAELAAIAAAFEPDMLVG